jgi:hypothetical protein
MEIGYDSYTTHYVIIYDNNRFHDFFKYFISTRHRLFNNYTYLVYDHLFRLIHFSQMTIIK